MKKIFAQILRRTAILSWLIRFISIPVSVVIINKTADLITEATQGNQSEVIRSGCFLLAFFVLTKMLNMCLNIVYERMLSQDKHRCKLEVYRLLFACPLSVLYCSHHGELAEKINDDFNTLVGRYTSLFPGLFVGIVAVILYTGYIAFLDIRVAGILLAISVLQMLPPLIIRKYMQQNYDNCRDVEAEVTDYTVEAYYGFQTIKSYALKDGWIERFRLLHQKYQKIGKTSIITSQAESSMVTLMDHILTYGTCAAVGVLVLTQLITFEVGVVAITLSKTLFSSVKDVFCAIPEFSVASEAERRLSDTLLHVEQGAENIPQPSFPIRLSNVSFTYREKEVLRNVSAMIPLHGLTVIKGKIGSGKSTLFRLLVGLLPLQKGNITVGGVMPDALSEHCFPFHIFYLPQDDPIYDLSAEELYLAIAPERAAEVRSLATKFGLDDAVFNRKISECSGGERKKVYLSLALTINPWLLMLDEPTNSLDSAGIELLKQLLSKRTNGTLLITHTSCFDDITDHLYHLEKGEVTQYA